MVGAPLSSSMHRVRCCVAGAFCAARTLVASRVAMEKTHALTFDKYVTGIGEKVIVTAQWAKEAESFVGHIEDSQGELKDSQGHRISQILVVTGELGSGKTTFAIQRGYMKFEKGNETFATFYVTARKCDEFEALAKKVKALDAQQRADEVEAECADFVKKLLLNARSRLCKKDITHVILDDCGTSHAAVEGIVNSVKQWAAHDVRLTLCGNGLDYAFGKPNSKANRAYYTTVDLRPWELADTKKLFDRMPSRQ